MGSRFVRAVRPVLTFMDVAASIVYEASRILNDSFPYSYEEGYW